MDFQKIIHAHTKKFKTIQTTSEEICIAQSKLEALEAEHQKQVEE